MRDVREARDLGHCCPGTAGTIMDCVRRATRPSIDRRKELPAKYVGHQVEPCALICEVLRKELFSQTLIATSSILASAYKLTRILWQVDTCFHLRPPVLRRSRSQSMPGLRVCTASLDCAMIPEAAFHTLPSCLACCNAVLPFASCRSRPAPCSRSRRKIVPLFPSWLFHAMIAQ
jgi:hypothetical protein